MKEIDELRQRVEEVEKKLAELMDNPQPVQIKTISVPMHDDEFRDALIKMAGFINKEIMPRLSLLYQKVEENQSGEQVYQEQTSERLKAKN